MSPTMPPVPEFRPSLDTEAEIKAAFERFCERNGHLPPQQFEALLFRAADQAVVHYGRRNRWLRRAITFVTNSFQHFRQRQR